MDRLASKIDVLYYLFENFNSFTGFWTNDSSGLLNVSGEEGFFSGIILMTCFHGLLLVLILLFNKELNSKSNKFLALSILGVCVILAYEFAYWMSLEDHIPEWILYLPLYIRTTIPVGVFYFVVFLIDPKHRLSGYEKLGFVFIGIEVSLTLVYIPLDLFVENANLTEQIEYLITAISWLLNIIASIILLPLALKRVNTYQKFLYNNYSTTSRKSLRWLQSFLIALLVVVFISVVSLIQYVLGDWTGGELTFTMLTLSFMMMLFWIGYFLVLQYKWFEIAPLKPSNGEQESAFNKLSSNTQNYYKQLKTLLQDENVYEDVNLTLDNLAEQLQISSGYLSQIIKENEEKNFFEFINTYRVASVKQKLRNEDYKNYTIMGIALESGFNSKSTFNAVFKKFANETPSAFKRRHV